jgi:hypothetical protein
MRLVSGPDFCAGSGSLVSAVKPAGARLLAAVAFASAADVSEDAFFWANARASRSFCASTSRSLNAFCFWLNESTDDDEGLMSPMPGALDCCIAVELIALTPERGAAAATREMVRQSIFRDVTGKGGKREERRSDRRCTPAIEVARQRVFRNGGRGEEAQGGRRQECGEGKDSREQSSGTSLRSPG